MKVRVRQAAMMSRAEAGGASFESLPRSGASVRPAKAGDSRFGPLPADRQRFLFPKSVAASCTFQSAAELANNSVVCHSEEQSDEESVFVFFHDSCLSGLWASAGQGCGPQACPEYQALCHSERSEESFPLRTKGRLRTMPSKEEKDKRSAVKHLYRQHTDSSSLCSSE